MMDYVTLETLDAKSSEWLNALGPFNAHDWRPDPSRCALMVIDCQNFFVGDPEPEGSPILPRIRSLAKTFRDAGRPVIFTRHMHKSDGSDLGLIGEWWADNIIEGTPESEIHPSLGALPDDIVISKNRYSAFHETDLDEILRENKVTELVITGVMTNLCCETTARDAFGRDYRVFFPVDANGTATEEMHFASLMNAAYGFGVVLASEDVRAAFE